MTALKILVLLVFIVVVAIGVIGFLWTNYPNSWLTQSLVYSKFKYIYEYSPGIQIEAVRVGKGLEFNNVRINLGEYSPSGELLKIRSTRSRMMLDGTPYDFSQITSEIVKDFGAQKKDETNSTNPSTWILERVINPTTHVYWCFNNTTLSSVYYDMQHPPDSAKGPAKPVPIQFSIEGSEWVQLPIKEKDLVRILGKPEKITREPMFP
jgi:hypothetical protein